MQSTNVLTNNENIEVEVVGYAFNWNEAYITFNWRNHTDMDIYYGSEFQLYAERDGKWGSCPVVDENMGWNSELYMLKSGAKTDRKLYLSGFDNNFSESQ